MSSTSLPVGSLGSFDENAARGFHRELVSEVCYAPGGTPRVYIEERGKNREHYSLVVSLTHVLVLLLRGDYGGPTDAAVRGGGPRVQRDS